MKIVYVILHYKTYEMTYKCIESILATNDMIDFHIVVVDNGSCNGTGEQLKDNFNNFNNITVLVNKENLGFANGNNLGYKFARDTYSPDAIVVMNNDIIIEQKDFGLILCNEIVKNRDIHVLAPDVINKMGKHQNPVANSSISQKKILYVLLYNIFLQIIMRVPFFNKLFLKYLKKRHEKKKNKNNIQLNKYDIVPHGAMIIYNKVFVEKEHLAFNPFTFLYCEEDLLYDFLKMKNYHTLYIDSLKVKHLEDVSTNFHTKTEIKKKLFMSKHKIKSCVILIKTRKKIKKMRRKNYNE